MKCLKKLRASAVALATLGIVFPLQSAFGDSPALSKTAFRLREAIDLVMSADGALRGVVVDSNGRGVRGTVVQLLREGEKRGEAITDVNGHFQFTNLSGGVYHILTPSTISLCRIWTNKAAPPSANRELLIATGDLVARGQRPICDLFFVDPLLVGIIVAAAIAIPIAIHNSDDDAPSAS